jgi:hypothetical protein
LLARQVRPLAAARQLPTARSHNWA